MRSRGVTLRLAALLILLSATLPGCDPAWATPPTPTLEPPLLALASTTPSPIRMPPASPTPTAASQPRPEPTATATPGRPSPTPSLSPPTPRPAAGPITSDPGAVVDAVRKVRPAVVNVSALQVSVDQFLRAVPEEAGVGSGVIFDRSGLILTNNHVVAGAERIRVSLPDGRSFDGRLVGADRRSDLAVVRIDATSLPVAELGDSDALQVGEWVVAIGNALALEGGPTVTAGVVGALDRYITTPSGNVLYDLIQTDAAINPGNSGGPLLNLAGQVVGINTAIAQTPGAGIGFAIAINRAKPVVADLVARGRVIRPWLGIQPVAVNPSLVAQHRLPVSEGALVVQVERGGPAAAAGIRAGDVIVGVADDRVRNVVTLLKAVARYRVGQSVKVTVARASGQQVFTLALEEMPD